MTTGRSLTELKGLLLVFDQQVSITIHISQVTSGGHHATDVYQAKQCHLGQARMSSSMPGDTVQFAYI